VKEGGGEPKDKEIEILVKAILGGYNYLAHRKGFCDHSWHLFCDILSLEIPLPFFMAALVLKPCITWGDVTYKHSEGTREVWSRVPTALINMLSEHNDPLISQPALLAQITRQMNKRNTAKF